MSHLLDSGWLLLLHQIPPNPAYLRAKILRRLNQIGALPVKNSAYLLPDDSDHLEHFQWIKSEIAFGGGEAWIFKVSSASLSEEGIQQKFRELRTGDYTQLLDNLKTAGSADWRKTKRRFEEVQAIDFFDAPGREELEAALKAIENKQEGMESPIPPRLELSPGQTWVTRKGVRVDRIASAWFIRRFLDPTAQFLFVDADHHVPQPGQIRFDMFDGEFTHVGSNCTFEVLVAHSSRADAALDAIAQMVHDIDLKDDKFQRPETAGLAAMIAGITALYPEDDRRLDEGARMLDATYASLKTTQR